MITQTVNGDLIAMLKQHKGEMVFTAHGCNCHAAMGSGYAPLIAKAFNGLREVDVTYRSTFKDNIDMLGTYSKLTTDHVTIYNAYTQYHPGADLRLDALGKAFANMNRNVKNTAIKLDVKPVLYIPRIGAGIAGGDWDEISEVINQNTPDIDVIVYVY